MTEDKQIKLENSFSIIDDVTIYEVVDNEINVTTVNGKKYNIDYSLDNEKIIYNNAKNHLNKMNEELKYILRNKKYYLCSSVCISIIVLSLLILFNLLGSYLILINSIVFLILDASFVIDFLKLNKRFKSIKKSSSKLEDCLQIRKININYNSYEKNMEIFSNESIDNITSIEKIKIKKLVRGNYYGTSRN